MAFGTGGRAAITGPDGTYTLAGLTAGQAYTLRVGGRGGATPATRSVTATGGTTSGAGFALSTVVASNTVRASGNNTHGQLGNGTSTTTVNPTPVTGLSGVVQVASGYIHAAALMSDGTLRSWGNNSYGQLGDNTTVNRSTVPVAVQGLTGAVQVGSWQWGYGCAPGGRNR